ncbi:hypothetical protein [Janthinobacterium fluminis]|uniref:Uncharacterized protein n=1 Tax=Janthinobacterium fluminis TaxID=2987524 RepID=A0ABT5JZ76_9BURK|nr:hypothetical protein [Janthinobacterium fluminis]MDC8757346.1 hypothetical protein [Janthinobacterium fluminis]
MMTTLFLSPQRRAAAMLAGLAFALPAAAQLQRLDDQALSRVHGQGLLTMSNGSLGGFDFTRIGFDADIALSANLRNVRLGEYSLAARNGLGADIDMPLLQFGRSDAGDAARLVQISNPYFEFVYRGDAAAREVIGMRIGFDGISGDVGLKLASLSGSLRVGASGADGAPLLLDSRLDPGGGKRWDGACAAPCLPMAQLGGVRAGDASGPSRDFWISMLKTGVQFQAPAGSAQLPDPAQAGLWLNWRDRLVALGVNGVTPPNLPKGR